jgi:hypothetical protein
MWKKLILGLGLSFLVGLGVAGASELDELRQKADSLWRDRGDLSQAVAAIEAYREVLRQNPDEIEAAVRIAYGYWWLGRNSLEKK